MSSKVSTICMIALLLFFVVTCAARPGPSFSDVTPMKTQHDQVMDVEGEGAEKVEVVEEGCEGIGEEECLMRRTLAAHTDYIYTQKHTP